MPYVVLEAIAAGLPMVATRVGGVPEIFGPYADELVPPGDAEALAVAIDRMLADPAKAARDAQTRREWLKPRFHIDVMQEQVDKLYQMILDRKTARRTPRERPAPLAAGARAAREAKRV